MSSKYFLDANVILSGVLWRGNERKLLELGEKGKLSLLTSGYVLREVEEVLDEMNFEGTKIIELLIFIRSFIDLVDVSKDEIVGYWDALDDKEDVPALAGAIESKSILVTGDKELLEKGSKFLIVKKTKEVLDENLLKTNRIKS